MQSNPRGELPTKAKAASQLVGEVDETELACRIMEACLDMKRPEGKTADQAFESIPPHLKGEVVHFKRAARAAMLYWVECIQNAHTTN